MSHKLLVDQNLIKYLINFIVILIQQVLGMCVFGSVCVSVCLKLYDIFPFTTVKLPVIILATKKFSVNHKKLAVCTSTVMLE